MHFNKRTPLSQFLQLGSDTSDNVQFYLPDVHRRQNLVSDVSAQLLFRAVDILRLPLILNKLCDSNIEG